MSGKVINDLAEAGTGLIVIKREVIEAMDYPYFDFEWKQGAYLPEDVNFCRKAKAKGFNVAVHTGWHVDHIGRHRYSPTVGFGIAENRDVAQAKDAQAYLKQTGAFEKARQEVV